VVTSEIVRHHLKLVSKGCISYLLQEDDEAIRLDPKHAIAWNNKARLSSCSAALPKPMQPSPKPRIWGMCPIPTPSNVCNL
jgi:hypothetical protein